jgi:FKBP-type peptidyl-prolyl cis-trans isomerase (trigger factor)
VEKWMDGHFDAWMTQNCYALLSTLKANAQKDFEKGAKKRGYSYTTSDMIQLLALTREEMTHMTVLIDHEERLLRKRTKRQTEGRKERPHSTGQTREKWLEQIKASSQEQAKPWEVLNISRKTFYKRKKQGLI